MSLEHFFPSGITDVIPAGFIEFLCNREPMLMRLNPKQQYGVARIVWTRYAKRHQHRKYPEYYSIHSHELRALLGHDYKQVYTMLGLLEKKSQWSVEKHWTCAYELLPKWTLWWEQFLIDVFKSSATFELMGKDRKIRRRQNGIISRGKDTNTAKTQARIPFGVRVNLDAIREAINCLTGQNPYPAHLQHLLHLASERRTRTQRELLMLWVLADNTILPAGEIPHEYVEVDSGRLFGRGQHLQNVCREVKAIALSGMGLEEYDFSNCHFAIFAQLAKWCGSHCPVIDDYLQRKQSVRSQIKQDIGVDVEVVKQCLLMALYGSNPKCDRSEIASLLEPDELERLRLNPTFMGIYEEIKLGRMAILKQVGDGGLKPTYWHKGKLVNVMTKSLKTKSLKRGNRAKQLAHILQGYEAKILNVVLEQYGPHLRLLQHDGFVSSIPIDTTMVCSMIEKETGLVMQLEKEVLP